ncbi:retrovirus-related pol polyprotein from transposon TNT 1-94 [Tanacetum coccineum]
MPLSDKTILDSHCFVHELKKEMNDDLEYVKSLEKEVDELESEKADFSNIYDLLLEEVGSLRRYSTLARQGLKVNTTLGSLLANLSLEGVDLLIGSQGNNLYTLSLGEMMASSPICLLSKASKTKHCLVRGLPKLKFEKDHLCSACVMGKSKKKPHKPKSEDTNQEKLYLLHMDLCGPMRVASVNGKKYILVIVDDYSRFTWVKCLRSKDEAPDFIIKFLKMIQVRLKVPVRRIRTDNGTEFVNQTLREYYEKVGISHETSVARSP